VFAEPTVNDFLALIDWHIDKALERARRAVGSVRSDAAARGMLNSSVAVRLTGLLASEALRAAAFSWSVPDDGMTARSRSPIPKPGILRKSKDRGRKIRSGPKNSLCMRPCAVPLPASF
jgi:hypothetical protein